MYKEQVAWLHTKTKNNTYWHRDKFYIIYIKPLWYYYSITTPMIKATVRSPCDYVLKDVEQSQVNQFKFGTELHFGLVIFRC